MQRVYVSIDIFSILYKLLVEKFIKKYILSPNISYEIY